MIKSNDETPMPQPTEAPPRKSLIVPRSVADGGRKIGLSVEGAFWAALTEIAAAQGTSVGRLVATINRERQHADLSSALRLIVLDYYRRRVAEGQAHTGSRTRTAQTCPRHSAGDAKAPCGRREDPHRGVGFAGPGFAFHRLRGKLATV
jgi:predicted DNA-binding ribbon-helix-helix protein